MSLSWLKACGLIVAVVAGLALEHRAIRAAELPPQTNRDGSVTVTVTPRTVSSTAPAMFEIVLDTHTVALSQDMLDIAVLSVDGSELKPTSWEGDPPGGHHRKGVLVFPPVTATQSALVLTLHDVGGVRERRFAWTLAP